MIEESKMEENKILLPIGSIVKVKGVEVKVMITSYGVSTRLNPNEIWDYGGCMYPIGTLSNKTTIKFDSYQITDVFFIGYRNEKAMEYLKNLTLEIEGLKRVKKVIKNNG